MSHCFGNHRGHLHNFPVREVHEQAVCHHNGFLPFLFVWIITKYVSRKILQALEKFLIPCFWALWAVKSHLNTGSVNRTKYLIPLSWVCKTPLKLLCLKYRIWVFETLFPVFEQIWILPLKRDDWKTKAKKCSFLTNGLRENEASLGFFILYFNTR